MANLISQLDRYRQVINNWWLGIIIGIACVIMGIVVFRYPGESYMALSVFFGIIILASGVSQIFVGAYAPKGTGRGWLIASGVIEAVLGFILIFHLAVSAVVLPLFVGFWLLFRSLTMIGFAGDMRSAGIKGTGCTIFWAILLMICSFMILIFPAVGVGAIVVWLGVSFIVVGVGTIFFAAYLFSQKKNLKA